MIIKSLAALFVLRFLFKLAFLIRRSYNHEARLIKIRKTISALHEQHPELRLSERFGKLDHQISF
jgi:hypothetical protein